MDPEHNEDSVQAGETSAKGEKPDEKLEHAERPDTEVEPEFQTLEAKETPAAEPRGSEIPEAADRKPALDAVSAQAAKAQSRAVDEPQSAEQAPSEAPPVVSQCHLLETILCRASSRCSRGGSHRSCAGAPGAIF